MEKIVLPLSPTDMVAFFADKEQEYLIDFHESIKNLSNPKFLLMYIANLGLTCNIDVITPKLLEEYMQLKEFCNVVNLKLTHANVLYLAKYGEVLYTEQDRLLSLDDSIDFAMTHHNILIHQMAFLNSMPLYILTRLGAKEGDRYGPLKERLVTLESDEQYDEIGYSLIQLFTVPDFLLAYLHTNIPLEDQIYFVRYFDEYMFNGGNIFSYVFHEKNAYAGLFQLVSDMDAGDDEATTTVTNLLADMQAILATNDPI